MPNPSGRQFVLERGAQRAVVVEVGGGIRTYEVSGIPLIDGYAESEACPAAAGQILAPWPNRIEDGRYDFDGISHQLPINDPDKHNALHGFFRQLPWEIQTQTSTRVELTGRFPPSQGYPFALQLSARWSLTDDGLRADLLAKNVGPSRCPFGLGVHPYLLPVSGSLDEQKLTVPASRRIVSDSRGLPWDKMFVEGTQWDFRKGRTLGGLMLDDAFEGLMPNAQETISVVRLENANGAGSEVWMDAAFPTVQVYSADTLSGARRRRSLAIEPMTCPANAFRSGEHLIVLEPAQTWRGSWGIRGTR